jgi:hypothetical protein
MPEPCLSFLSPHPCMHRSMQGNSEKLDICELGRKPSLENNPADTLILNF